MSHTLHQRLMRIRKRVRRVLWVYGLSWLVAVVLGAILLVGSLDWLLHLDDSGLRLMLALGIVAGGIWIVWCDLIRPLSTRLSDIDIALKIEARFPGFNDSLASTMQFVEQKANPRIGSPEMQQRVISETIEQVDRVDIDDLLETRDVRRIAVVAVLVTMLVSAVVGLKTAEAATALGRLVFPFSETTWPKQTELQIVDTSWHPFQSDRKERLRIAEGKKLELYVENLKGRLPDDAVLQYRLNDEEIKTEPLHKVTRNDETGRSRNIGVTSLTAISGPVWFRAVGGDDRDMEWRVVDVVSPPLIDEMQVLLTPPDYTGRSVIQLPAGVGHVQGMLGTRVDLNVVCSKPVSSAMLQIKGRPDHPIKQSDDGLRFTSSFVITNAGMSSYGFALTDQRGFRNDEAPRYNIQGIADLVPELYIDEPPADMTVTPAAVVPLRIVAKDDLGLKQIRLSYALGQSSDEQGVLLPLFSGEERPQQQTIDYRWNLSDFGLVEGVQIAFHAEATDDYDLGPEHVGRSLSRTLTVVSKEEKIAELDSHQGDLQRALERIEEMQTQAHGQVDELLLQLEKVGTLKPEDLDLLKRVELDQRQIASNLFNPIDGVENRVRELFREFQNNSIDDSETSRRLGLLAEELRATREEQTPHIERTLTRARKLAGETPDKADSKKQKRELATAGNHQAVVLESLESMLEKLSRWRNQRDLTGEVNELLADQKGLNRETAEVSRQTLTKSWESLTPQQQADLAKLARRQRQQGDGVAKLREKLDEAILKTAESRPDDADALRDAREHLEQRATASRMREAADQLEMNKVGRATSGQQQAIDDLTELQDLLENRGASDLEELVKKLKQAERELDELHSRQEELLKKVEQSAQNEDPAAQRDELMKLQRQQRQLRAQAEGMVRRLRRLQARKPSGSSKRAAAQMAHAENSLGDEETDSAIDEQQEALEDLEQAQRELAEARRDAEEKLAYEMLEKIASQIKGMVAREQSVIDETRRLDVAYKQRGNWSRGQLKSLRQLADHQRQLKEETDGMAKSLKSAEVFALALRGAAKQMQTAAQRISSRQTDQQTVRVETRAKQRFLDLLAALKQEQKPGDSSQAQEGAGGDSSGQPGDGIPQLAQLKMLKTLQEDLQSRTGEIDKARSRNGPLSAEQRAELRAIADEQGDLVDLSSSLIRAVTEAFEVEDENGDPKQSLEAR